MKNTSTQKILISAVFAFLILNFAFTEIPHIIQYQGKATDKSGFPLSGNHNITLRIYDSPTTTTILWEEQHLSIPLTNGKFSLQMGSHNALNLPFDKSYWLGVEIDNDGEMTPRERLVSVPYAYQAQTAQYAVTVQKYLIPNYITGCELEYIDQNNFRVTPGSIELDGKLLTRVTYSSNIDLGQSSNWLHGSENPNMWIYVYLGKEGSSWKVKISDEPPNAFDTEGNKDGDLRYRMYDNIYYRCIGAVRNDDWSILRFYQSKDWVYFDHKQNVLFLTNTSSNTFTDIDCSSCVPRFSKVILFNARCLDNGSGGGTMYWYFRRNGSLSLDGMLLASTQDQYDKQKEQTKCSQE